LLVQTKQYDELRELVLERVQKMRLGSVLRPSAEGYISTVDCGSMISTERFEGIEKLIKEAEEAGAHVEGGKRWTHVYNENGAYFSATVVGPVYDGMKIAQQECEHSSLIGDSSI
jgi:acyl-CoA reductase-like NAD-dependent aldehyde dehydrogenase